MKTAKELSNYMINLFDKHQIEVMRMSRGEISEGHLLEISNSMIKRLIVELEEYAQQQESRETGEIKLKLWNTIIGHASYCENQGAFGNVYTIHEDFLEEALDTALPTSPVAEKTTSEEDEPTMSQLSDEEIDDAAYKNSWGLSDDFAITFQEGFREGAKWMQSKLNREGE